MRWIHDGVRCGAIEHVCVTFGDMESGWNCCERAGVEAVSLLHCVIHVRTRLLRKRFCNALRLQSLAWKSRKRYHGV